MVISRLRGGAGRLTTSCCKCRAFSAMPQPLNDHPYNNVPPSVAAKIGVNLHRRQRHPLNIIKTKIERYFQDAPALSGNPEFSVHDSLPPVVTTIENFDQLLIPKDHVSRRPSDTYYVDEDHVLRTHTSAHQVMLLSASPKGSPNAFLVCGDVYRRDEVDCSHYPVFHQLEGVRVFGDKEIPPSASDEEKSQLALADLKNGLEGMVAALFGNVEMRWVDAYFPFTSPSAELEILFKGKWLEVLGCGVIEKGVLERAGQGGSTGWAFGLGLERLAMVLFSIPDIRLFWSEDARFTSQFQSGELVTFQPYSKYPPCTKDISFWLPKNNDCATIAKTEVELHANDVCQVVREVAGDVIEEVVLLDDFRCKKTDRRSTCYRLVYRSMDKNLTNAEIDQLQEVVRQKLVTELKVVLR